MGLFEGETSKSTELQYNDNKWTNHYTTFYLYKWFLTTQTLTTSDPTLMSNNYLLGLIP